MSKGKLHLRVNREKTIVSSVTGVKYLGYSFYNSKGKFELCVHPQSKVKLKSRLKALTGRSNGMGYERRKQKLNEYIRGWIGYYHRLLSPCQYEASSLGNRRMATPSHTYVYMEILEEP